VTSTAKRIFDEALALPDDERFALMEALSDSFLPDPVELSPEWMTEIKGASPRSKAGRSSRFPGKRSRRGR
jgi:hypothetical protein